MGEVATRDEITEPRVRHLVGIDDGEERALLRVVVFVHEQEPVVPGDERDVLHRAADAAHSELVVLRVRVRDAEPRLEESQTVHGSTERPLDGLFRPCLRGESAHLDVTDGALREVVEVTDREAREVARTALRELVPHGRRPVRVRRARRELAVREHREAALGGELERQRRAHARVVYGRQPVARALRLVVGHREPSCIRHRGRGLREEQT
jgi:hypothetical protein